ncbi:MAG: FecR domain-containing protein, partial [Planctomycetes bacterium]|nr:FecR domain-containing protein [Planctomycetota bacterium]
RERAALPAGRVEAGPGGLTLRLRDGSLVHAAPGTALTLTNTRALRLHRGRARFSVVSDPARPFRVETPRAPVRVRGTVFDLQVEEVFVAGTGIKAAGLAVVVGVSVFTGAVLFGEGGDAVEVRAGQAALADGKGVRRVSPDAQALERAQLAQREAEAEGAALRARTAELEREAADLRARVAQLEAQLGAETPTAPAPEAGAPPPTRRRVFTFGDSSAERGALETLDWQTPAEAVQTMVPLLTRVHAALVAGETPDQELQVAIYKANSKLVEAYLEVRGKLPTHAQGNGEYAHPAFMANLVDAYLESAGQPLDEGQRAQIEALGRAYDAAWAQAQLGYGEQTVTSRKLYDELVLKAEFRAGLDRLLSGAQLALLGDEALRHVSGMDLFSPVLVFSASAKVLPGADEAKLLEQLQGTLSSLGVELALPGVDRVLADWLAAAAGPPVAEGQTWSYTLADGLRALDAQAAAFEQLTQLALPDEQRAALRDASWVVLPRLTSPE